ncbi:fatty acid transporter [Agaricicola taiwanensis]|uniref:Fatty acid transporter n=1 Tax=Agaricicola taiwanensis TaxID=591372 RepID=A0A8J2YHJ5_9RHOB|nr:outer membrane protein transport protein [Agaricicola taiwanensis]GGE42903.1 fatty acid transporter [Agaricicola taiwanensis]
MSHHLKTLAFAATSVAGVLATLGAAEAGGFALREQSAYGQGWSFAGSAAGGPGVSGMFWNPALVTNSMAKVTIDSSYSLVAPIVELEGVGNYPSILSPTPFFGESGDMGQDALVPATSGSIRLTDDLYLGLSLSGPFGLVTKPNPGWVGSYDSYSSRIFSINATPTIGYRINDWISIGAGIQFQYLKADLKNFLPVGLTNQLLDINAEDDLGIGFTAGVQLRPTPTTEVGIGFRSSVTHELDSDARLGAAPVLPFDTKLHTPEVVTLGVRQRIGDAFTVAGTVEWTNWSRLGTLRGEGPGAAYIPGAALPFEYDDGWFFSGGVEYQYSPEFSLRAGIGYEISPISDEDRSTRLPDSDRLWLSAGGSYNWSERLSFDLGYSFITALGDGDINRTVDVAGLGTRALFVGETDAVTHVVSVGIRYKFGNPEPAAVVAKY